jgi:hypothetical protein
MELLRTKATRTRLSEIVYYVLNGVLPIVVLILVRGFDPPYLALAIVLLSKWRIFALRPRFWWPNIKANMVDVLVGVSVVGLLYLSSADFLLQIIITLLYGGWLLGIKPKSSANGIMLQAGIAQFVALLVLFHFSTVWNELFVVLGGWAIGYVAARHVVSNYEEPKVELWSAVWGLLVAQMSWLMFHWTVVYNLGMPILVPQVALIMLVLGFSAARLYGMQQSERLNTTVIRGTTLFTVALILVILLFSPWDATL